MQVLLDSLRGAIGLALAIGCVILIVHFVMNIEMPARSQIDAYYAAKSRQTTIMFGGLLMLVTMLGIGVFAYNVWRS